MQIVWCQGKLKKKREKKDVKSSAIVDAIKEFLMNVQEIKKFKIETIEMITSQMLHSEKESK
jgi:hypothetical protein